MAHNELLEFKMSETDIPKEFLYALYEFASDQYIPLWDLCYGISKHLETKISPLEADELFELICESSELADYYNSGIDMLNTVTASEIDEAEAHDMYYGDEKNFEYEVNPRFYYE